MMDYIQIFLRVLSLFFMLVSMALIGWMLVTFHRVRSISALNCVVSVVITSMILVVYWIIVGTNLHWIILIALILFGMGLGFLMGQTTKVWFEEGERKAKNTIWYLIIWAACYLVTQTLVSMGHALSLNIGIGAIMLGTGVTVGSQGNIFLRLLLLSPKASGKNIAGVSGETLPSTRFCRQCGSGIKPKARFCSKCGAES
jgi:hypothetical protein